MVMIHSITPYLLFLKTSESFLLPFHRAMKGQDEAWKSSFSCRVSCLHVQAMSKCLMSIKFCNNMTLLYTSTIWRPINNRKQIISCPQHVLSLMDVRFQLREYDQNNVMIRTTILSSVCILAGSSCLVYFKHLSTTLSDIHRHRSEFDSSNDLIVLIVPWPVAKTGSTED